MIFPLESSLYPPRNTYKIVNWFWWTLGIHYCLMHIKLGTIEMRCWFVHVTGFGI